MPMIPFSAKSLRVNETPKIKEKVRNETPRILIEIKMTQSQTFMNLKSTAQTLMTDVLQRKYLTINMEYSTELSEIERKIL